MALSLDNFVSINIEPSTDSRVSSTQDTVAYIVSDYPTGIEEDCVISALPSECTDSYLKHFFNNGGLKVKVIKGTSFSAGMAKVTNEIVIMTDSNLTNIKTYINSNPLTAKTHIFVKNITTNPSAAENIYNLVLKRGSNGIEGTIAAHLCKINVDRPSTFSDYAFTIENGIGANDLVNTDADAAILKSNFVNFDTTLVNATRALYGDDTSGKDFTNNYVLILLQRTLRERLVETLMGKLRYNTNSLNIIHATISKELDRYVNLGYLQPNKQYTGETMYSDDGRVIITQYTLMTLGYVISIAPLSTLSPAQKQNHEIPNIDIILGDSMGIRKITVSGKVA